MATTYYDPYNVQYDSGGSPVAVAHCVSVEADGGAMPRKSRSDDGTITIFVPGRPITGNFNFDDPTEAALMAKKTAGGADLTFDVKDDGGAAKRVTITNIKTGGVRSSYAGGSASRASVPFVADTINTPQNI